MTSDSVPTVAEPPAVDYAHLPGEEANPLMESTAHVDWINVLLNAARHTLAGTGALVTGNVPFAPADGGPHTAPDVMVIPGAAGRSFGRYEPGPGDPMPSVCVEVLSPSNTRIEISRRTRRLLRLGVAEVYVLDPERETVAQITTAGDLLEETDAVGRRSPGLALTFTMVDGHLALCCPGGRVVRPGDDPFGWLVDERHRAERAQLAADQARAEAGQARAEADQARARAAALEAEVERLRRQAE